MAPANVVSPKLGKAADTLIKQMASLQKQMLGLDRQHRALLQAAQGLDPRGAKRAADEVGKGVTELEATLKSYEAGAKALPTLVEEARKEEDRRKAPKPATSSQTRP